MHLLLSAHLPICFLGIAALVPLGISPVEAAPAAVATRVHGPRPNIVFILSDDHAWQAISAYGDERHLIQTPNIDRLAREGMRFDRCIVPNPLCGPSR
ncbi:MAG: sulfatase-like hydrolase/transferase, partial [Opitutaceae bacterium]|nr:sulfatase-like hydrolase/transferase [Opitutaceae bacterium]